MKFILTLSYLFVYSFYFGQIQRDSLDENIFNQKITKILWVSNSSDDQHAYNYDFYLYDNTLTYIKGYQLVIFYECKFTRSIKNNFFMIEIDNCTTNVPDRNKLVYFYGYLFNNSLYMHIRHDRITIDENNLSNYNWLIFNPTD